MLKVWTENDAQYVSGNKDIGEREEMEGREWKESRGWRDIGKRDRRERKVSLERRREYKERRERGS